MIDRVHALLVEDNPGDARLIREMLAGRTVFGYSFAVTHAETLRAAEEQLSVNWFDIILLDLHLPDSTGLDTLTALSDISTRIPVIVLTGLSDDRLTAKAVSIGAQDYIPKSECNPQFLRRIIHYAIERKQAEERLRHLAMHDPLTGLANRALLYDRLARALQRSQRKEREISAKWKFAIMMVDLDNFKLVNDTLGHEAGDQTLQQVARRLESCLRQSDSIGRWGGDEFVVMLEGIRDRSDCTAVTRKISQALKTPPIPVGNDQFLSASVGISLFPDDGEDFDTLLRYADRAMYTSKGRKGASLSQQDETRQ